MNPLKLTGKCKAFEAAFDLKIPANKPFVVRLDGVGFKRYTAKLKKPFDPGFTKALQETTVDLMDRFGTVTGFCQSDEITLIGSPATENDSKNLIYQGRIQKISSVLASFAAGRFNEHMRLLGHNSTEPAIFDARVFSVDSWLDAAEVLIWRQRHDCRRNALHAIAQAHFTKTELDGQPIKEVIDRLLKEKGVDAYTAYPLENVFGSFVKRIKVTTSGFNPLTKQQVSVERFKLVARAFDLTTDNPDELENFVKNSFFLE